MLLMLPVVNTSRLRLELDSEDLNLISINLCFVGGQNYNNQDYTSPGRWRGCEAESVHDRAVPSEQGEDIGQEEVRQEALQHRVGRRDDVLERLGDDHQELRGVFWSQGAAVEQMYQHWQHHRG